MAAARYNYKYIIKAVPIANITVSETGDTIVIEPIPTFINSSAVTEEIEDWLINYLPELMTNNSYVDPYMGDIYYFSDWAYWEGITNYPYVKEIASSEGILDDLDWSAELPEGKVYFAYVEEQEWWNGMLNTSYMVMSFVFRLPFLSGDNQLGTNLIGESSNFIPS